MRYIRKRGETKLHIWTPELAKRDDMIELEESEIRNTANPEPVKQLIDDELDLDDDPFLGDTSFKPRGRPKVRT